MEEKKIKSVKREKKRLKNKNAPKGGTLSAQQKKIEQDNYYSNKKGNIRNLKITMKKKNSL